MNNILATPSGNIRAQALPMIFKALPIGAKFELNGNVWIKRSKRTAQGYWPACLPEWAYVGGSEKVYFDNTSIKGE